jgi:MFS family permease
LPNLDTNGWRLLAGKAFRAFGFGLSSVVLGLYFAAIDLSPAVIGIVLSAALAGTTVLTLIIMIWGDKVGRRRLLIIGSALMLVPVFIPLVGANPIALVAIGLSGMVAVTSNESTGLQSIDQAILPQTVPPHQRTAAFALYNVVASTASAAGALMVGPVVTASGAAGLDGPMRYGPPFAVFAASGLAAAILVGTLDHRAEVRVRVDRGFAIQRSRRTVVSLSSLFAVDALAGGFVVQSYLAFWFASRFSVDDSTIGLLFAASSILAALSFPVAVWLAAHIGLINTMVLTHIPASLSLALMAFVPELGPAIALFLIRSAFMFMDVPTRQSYTMAIVDADERTATAGITSLARSGAQMIAPAIAGSILVPLGFGVPLLAAGLLMTSYDVALFAVFRNQRPPEEAQAQ